MTISFGDRVRVRPTPETVPLRLANLVGQVYGETRPSVTGVEVIGGTAEDYAINVAFPDRADTLWFSPDSLEFMDHAPGTEIVIGNQRFVRSASGDWVKEYRM
jgi:hypothetical protein